MSLACRDGVGDEDEAEIAAHRARLKADVLQGLTSSPKSLPPKYFYDERGSSLFQSISQTPEYYLTRSELAIMEQSADEIASAMGPGCLLIEYGSGAADKAHLVLDLLEEPAGYISIDISKKHLADAVDSLARSYRDLEVLGVHADFTADFELPEVARPVQRRVIYFAGSTIGNFEPAEARELLLSMRRRLLPGGGLLVGIDLKKDEDRLLRAYNDSQGFTAAFNRNILVRINRELGADFDPELFGHRAIYNRQLDRIEMYLVSRTDQTVQIDGVRIGFRPGETIHTESSHKYELAGFSSWAAPIGFRLHRSWTDPEGDFGVLLLTVAPPESSLEADAGE